MSSSAWEQWGGKRPTGGVLANAQGALSGFLHASPLSSNASTASSDSESPSTSTGTATTTPSFSLARLWDSAKKKSTVSDADAMENGEAGAATGVDDTDEDANLLSPVWKRKAPKEGATGFAALGWGTRFKYCVALSLLAVLFFGMASVFLPLIVVRPAKFALSFTFGSICAMGAVAMLKGPMAYVRDLILPKNIVLTTVYVVTLALTLYSCLVLGNFVMVVVSSVCQLITLFFFVASALPGGNTSLKAFGMAFTKAARHMMRAFVRLLR